MLKKVMILTLSFAFLLSSFFILKDLVYAQVDWCYIKEKAKALYDSTPRNLQECQDWLKEKKELEDSYRQALNWSGTAIGVQCMDEFTTLLMKVQNKVEKVENLAIDYSTENLPAGCKEIFRFVRKESRPEKVALVLIAGGISFSTGGMAPVMFLAATATKTGLGIAGEHVGVLEEDGIYSPNQAKTAKFYLGVAEIGVSLATLPSGENINLESIAVAATKIGIKVSDIRKTAEGYSFRAMSEGVSQTITLKSPHEKVSITFPEIKISKFDIENISGTLSLTQDDLKNGEVEIRGRIEDGANGANTQKVQIDVGDGWRDVQGRVNWKYSLMPEENREYRLTFRAIDLEGEAHESLFGTVRLIYASQQKGEDDKALIREVIYGWENAFKNQDLEKAMSYLADSYWYEDEGWDRDRERVAVGVEFRNYDCKKREPSNLNIEVSGDTANATYNSSEVLVHSTTGAERTWQGVMYLKLRKINGKWLIERERSSQ